jgi:predicted TPR repeat methyltransferase
MAQDTVAARRYDFALGELANGQPAAAVSALKQALSLDPGLVSARHHLDNAIKELERLESALLNPAASAPPADVYTELGTILWKLGDSAGALAAFERVVATSAGSAEAHYNLGCVQLESGRLAEAVESAREAIRLGRGFSEALLLCAAGLAATGTPEAGVELLRQLSGATLARRYLMLAVRLMSSRLFDPARDCLERVVREEPTDVMARHLLSALSGDNPDHPVEGYVRHLFDASAATFDRELVSKLGYVIPRQIVDALRAVDAAASPPWDVLDLGCGTGLLGAEIAPYSRRLVGIDLAPNMIERARARNAYTDLRCVDLMVGLMEDEAPQGDYDIVTAADVFIYVGKLERVVPMIRRVLRLGGLFAFSAEAMEATGRTHTAGYRLGVMGRYAHSAGYLRRLAGENGFDVELLCQTCIRFEHRRPVDGWLTVWRAV